MTALDLETGWLDYPRPKTGVARRCKLWNETVAALRDWLAIRPNARKREHARLVFITKYGDSWHKVVEKERLSAKQPSPAVDNPVTKEMAKLLHETGLKRPGLSFYALRHTFETVAGESRDQVAVDHIMGHARDDMASVYRERISDERLEAVVEQVRRWLFPA
jgi:integrase